MSRAAPMILALDCSAAACSAALWRCGEVAADRFETMSRGQAEALLPMVESVMQAAGAAYADLDLTAATVGPGSFTGLRIGLAAVRGIALAAGIPALGIGCFEAIAADLPATDQGRSLAVAIDDRRGGVYWQGFAAGGATPVGPRALAADEIAAVLAGIAPGLRPLLVTGDGVRVLRARADLAADLAATVEFGPDRPPSAAAVARLAARQAAAVLAGAAPVLPPRPVYLRAPDARLPARGGADPVAGSGLPGPDRASHGRA